MQSASSRSIPIIAVLSIIWAFLGGLQKTFGNTFKGDDLLDKINLAKWKVGPFRLRPEVIIGNIGLGAFVNSPQDYTDGFNLTAGPAITGYLVVRKKIIFTLYESPQYVYYYTRSQERGWNNFFRADVSIILKKLFLSTGAYWANTRNYFLFEGSLRPLQKQSDIKSSAIVQTGKNSGLSLDFSISRIRYDISQFDSASIAEQLDRNELRIAGGFFIQMTQSVRLFAQLEYGRYDFHEPLNPRNSESQTALAGLDFSSGYRINGRIMFGYRTLTPQRGGQADFQGLVADSSVSVIISRTIDLHGSFSRSNQYSLRSNARFYMISWSSFGPSIYFFKRRIRLDYIYNIININYPFYTDSTNPENIASSNNYSAQSIGLYVRLIGNAGLGVIANHRNHKDIGFDGGALDQNSKSNYITVNLTYGF